MPNGNTKPYVADVVYHIDDQDQHMMLLYAIYPSLPESNDLALFYYKVNSEEDKATLERVEGLDGLKSFIEHLLPSDLRKQIGQAGDLVELTVEIEGEPLLDTLTILNMDGEVEDVAILRVHPQGHNKAIERAVTAYLGFHDMDGVPLSVARKLRDLAYKFGPSVFEHPGKRVEAERRRYHFTLRLVFPKD